MYDESTILDFFRCINLKDYTYNIVVSFPFNDLMTYSYYLN